MLIRITDKVRLRIARPFWIEITKQPQLELKLPASINRIDIPNQPDRYLLRTLVSNDKSKLIDLFGKAGFEFNESQLEEILSVCLPQGCFVIEHIETKTLVATMMARHLSSTDYPFGGRIDWLATDPAHQGKGLGSICARSAAAHLLKLGYTNIWVTTDIHRMAALKIFISIGFEPVIINESRERWKIVYEDLKIPNNL